MYKPGPLSMSFLEQSCLSLINGGFDGLILWSYFNYSAQTWTGEDPGQSEVSKLGRYSEEMRESHGRPETTVVHQLLIRPGWMLQGQIAKFWKLWVESVCAGTYLWGEGKCTLKAGSFKNWKWGGEMTQVSELINSDCNKTQDWP